MYNSKAEGGKRGAGVSRRSSRVRRGGLGGWASTSPQEKGVAAKA